eukprot:1472379-Amphidinium_carterae.1
MNRQEYPDCGTCPLLLAIAKFLQDIEVKFAKDGDTGTQQMYDLQRFITRRCMMPCRQKPSSLFVTFRELAIQLNIKHCIGHLFIVICSAQ